MRTLTQGKQRFQEVFVHGVTLLLLIQQTKKQKHCRWHAASRCMLTPVETRGNNARLINWPQRRRTCSPRVPDMSVALGLQMGRMVPRSVFLCPQRQHVQYCPAHPGRRAPQAGPRKKETPRLRMRAISSWYLVMGELRTPADAAVGRKVRVLRFSATPQPIWVEEGGDGGSRGRARVSRKTDLSARHVMRVGRSV